LPQSGKDVLLRCNREASLSASVCGGPAREPFFPAGGYLFFQRQDLNLFPLRLFPLKKLSFSFHSSALLSPSLPPLLSEGDKCEPSATGLLKTEATTYTEKASLVGVALVSKFHAVLLMQKVPQGRWKKRPRHWLKFLAAQPGPQTAFKGALQRPVSDGKATLPSSPPPIQTGTVGSPRPLAEDKAGKMHAAPLLGRRSDQ